MNLQVRGIRLWMRQRRWLARSLSCVAALLLLWTWGAQSARAAEQRSFELLDLPALRDLVSQESETDATPYVIGQEFALAARPSWADLEASAKQIADVRGGSFQGVGNRKIHYRIYQHRSERKGGVIIVTGRTEGLALYQETILDLLRNGYSVYIHDHRGQGFSERIAGTDSTLGHIDDFDNYVKDLATFIDGPVHDARTDASTPQYLLAHSMGGTIAALYLEGTPTSDIAAAALVTPMMEPWSAGGESPGFLQKLADTFCDRFSGRGGAISGVSTAYIQGAPFEKQYQDFLKSPDLLPNGASHSLVRFARNWNTRNSARCTGPDCGSPDARIGGASVRWFNQSCAASEQARGAAAERIKVPVLLLQGGQDIKVKPAAQAQFCANMNKNPGPGYCVGRTIAGAEHAMLMESDEFRVPALASALYFYNCVATGQPRCDRP